MKQAYGGMDYILKSMEPLACLNLKYSVALLYKTRSLDDLLYYAQKGDIDAKYRMGKPWQ